MAMIKHFFDSAKNSAVLVKPTLVLLHIYIILAAITRASIKANGLFVHVEAISKHDPQSLFINHHHLFQHLHYSAYQVSLPTL